MEEGLTAEQRSTLLISLREELFAEATLLSKKFCSLTKENFLSFKAHYDRLTSLESEFKAIQLRINIYNASVKESKEKIEALQVYTTFMELILVARSKFQAFSTVSPPERDNTPQFINKFQNLPRIQLPIFSGNLEEWSLYFSLFESLVNGNNSLTNIEKFQYLRTSLRGDALAVISDFQLSPDNYPLALASLVNRYQNTRRLGSLYLSKITQYKPSSEPSYPNLKRFLNTHVNNFNALKALEIRDLSDFVQLHLSLENLDPESRRAFEVKYSDKGIPSFQNLIEFVTARSRVAELMGEDGKALGRPQPSGRAHTSPKSSTSYAHSLESGSEQKAAKTGSSPGVAPRPTDGNPNSAICWNCRGPGHVYSKCKKPLGRFCFRCGKSGVIVTTCPDCNQGNEKRGKRRRSF